MLRSAGFRLVPACALLALLASCGGGSGRSSQQPQQSQPPPTPAPPAANRPPAVAIAVPTTGNSFAEGEQVRFEGSAQDPEDGSIVGSGLVWTLTTGGDLGTGDNLVVTTLPRGTHTIQLAATDSSGARSTASVSIRITAPARAPERRPGETNPYAGRIDRRPVKQDDEVVLIGRARSANELVYGVVDEPLSRYNFTANPTPALAPRISLRRSGVTAIAAAAGRILPSGAHQAALVTMTTYLPAEFQLEVVGLLNAGEDTVAEVAFTPPIAGGAIGLGVGDLDAFEELSGAKALTAPAGRNSEYHDEVTLAYPETVGAQLRARVRVFSFEDVGFPELRDGPAPGATTEVSALSSVALLPGSRLVVAHGDAFFSNRTGPHLLIAYLNAAQQVVADVYEYRHTRASDSDGNPRTDTRALVHVQHIVLTTTPVTAGAAAAGGWDVVVGTGHQLGIRNPLSSRDVVVVARHENGRFLQDAWTLESLTGPATDPPTRLGSGSFPFGRFTDSFGAQIDLTILDNSPIHAVLGRVVQPGAVSCEAVGLLVLADTNRGAVVQSMSVFVQDPTSGTGVIFGPLRPLPPWPSALDLRGRAATTQLTRAAIAAGGLVSDRNGLIDHRGVDAIGNDAFARQCQGVDSQPMLGPMPSFYVAEPEAARLSAVTIAPAGNSEIIVGALDGTIDEKPLMLAADVNGDAAYYDSTRCIEQPVTKCRRLFLGDADFHYFIENFETQNVILQQPPKHVDYLRALGGIVDVSMRDNYLAEFIQTTTNDGSVSRKLKTDWSLGARLGIGWGSSSSGSAAQPKGGFTDENSRSSDSQLTIDLEHRSVATEFNATTATVSLTQTTGAVDDDVVWSKIQTTDFWRFPVQGGRLEGAPASATVLSNNAYMEIAVPGEPVTSIGAGSASDAYQPTHQVGNILTYPMIRGASQDIGELFDFLGAYIPMNEDGSRQCKPLQDDNPGCIAVVNGVLTQVAEVLAGQEFVAGEFERLTNPVDVAEELQVGGISYSVELQFNTNVRRGATVVNTDTIKATLKTKASVKPGAKFEPKPGSGKGAADKMKSIEAELRAQASFENERISENNLGSQTKIALRVPANIPIQRSYRVRPSFGFTPGGTLQVSYEVSTQGPGVTFWEQHYGTPDAALNLPFRIVRSGLTFVLNTDFSRNRMKGFFVRDGSGIDAGRPWEEIGPLLTAAPNAGDPVQLEVQVFNLSVGTALSNLGVEFTAQAYENGNPTGPELPIGRTTIDYLPFRGQFADEPNGHIASAFVIWDTTSFGPSSPTSLKDYLVYVTLDPSNAINNETHELIDRYNDSLKGPTGDVLDATLEKGQNNRGWNLVRIAPSLTITTPTQISGRGTAGEPVEQAPVRLSLQTADDRGVSQSFEKPGWMPRLVGQARQPLQLSIGLQSEGLSRDHGVLQLFDGDPELGARMIASRAVQGLAGDDVTVEELEWWPQSAGDRVLYVRYFGSGGVVTRPLQLPVRVEP